MWTFNQKTGEIRQNGLLVDTGYAGRGEGKNNPEMEKVHNIGPLPVGKYRIGDPIDGTHLGPHAMPLTPDPSNEMFGRSAFYWHADDGKGTASEGCIVSGYRSRQIVSASGDRELEVISGEELEHYPT